MNVLMTYYYKYSLYNTVPRPEITVTCKACCFKRLDSRLPFATSCIIDISLGLVGTIFCPLQPILDLLYSVHFTIITSCVNKNLSLKYSSASLIRKMFSSIRNKVLIRPLDICNHDAEKPFGLYQFLTNEVTPSSIDLVAGWQGRTDGMSARHAGGLWFGSSEDSLCASGHRVQTMVHPPHL